MKAFNKSSQSLVNQDTNGVYVVDQFSIPRMMDQLQLTIRAKADGYSSARELATELYNDAQIDGEQLARRCGYQTFEAFLESKDAKKVVEVKMVDGRRHYCAPYDVRTHHIYNEQKKSMAAAAQRQQRDNRSEVRAGIIGRRDYGEHDRQSSIAGYAGRYNNNAMSNSISYGYDDARLSTNGLPSEWSTSTASVRCGTSVRDLPSPNHPSVRPFDYGLIESNHQQNQRQLLTATPQNYQALSRPSPFGNINNRFDNNTGLPDLGVRSDLKQHNQQPQSVQSYSGFPDNSRQNNLRELSNSTTLGGNQKISSAGSTTANIFDDDEEDAVGTIPSNQKSAKNQTTDLEGVKGVFSGLNDLPTNTSANNPLFLESNKNQESLKMKSQSTSGGNLLVRSSVSSLDTANLSVPKKTATIIWDETEEDELSNNNDNSSSQKKRSEQPKNFSSGHYFEDFSDSNEEDSEKQKEKKLQVVDSGKTEAPTQWTRRCVGEFTDSEGSDSETEKEGDNEKTSAASTLTKPPAVVVPLPRATPTNVNELMTSVKSKRPERCNKNPYGSDDDNTTIDEEEVRNRERKNKKIAVEKVDANTQPESFSTVMGKTLPKIVGNAPASHGEKWLFQLHNDNVEKGIDVSLGSRLEQQHQQEVSAESARPPSLTGAAPPPLLLQTAIKPNPTVANASMRLAESIAANAIGVGHSATNVGGARGTSGGDVLPPNEFSRQLEGRVVTESPNGMRRCESTASVYSILQSGRWRQELNEGDLNKMGTIVTSVVRYQFPRTILLDDLLAVMEQIDRRFANMEQLCNYVEFVEKYCTCVELLGRPGCHNLIWKEK